MPSLQQLKNIDFHLLDCLVRESNVTVAAERLQMSQGNMSNTLSRLRQLFDDPILVRTSKGMIPTDRALELQRIAQEVMSRMRSLVIGSERPDVATVASSIKIACADGTALFALGPLLEEMRLVAPNIHVEITQISNLHVREPLDDGSIDLAIGAYHDLPGDFQITRLIRDEMMCMIGTRHYGEKQSLSIEEYAQGAHAVLSVGYGFRATIETVTDEAMSRLGLSRNIRLSSQYTSVLADVISRSDLIATFPSFMIRQFARHLPVTGATLPLSLPVFSLSAVWRADANENWVLSWFRQQLRRHMQARCETNESDSEKTHDRSAPELLTSP
jgi:DNA-binding transcriptional LysR family regulator